MAGIARTHGGARWLGRCKDYGEDRWRHDGRATVFEKLAALLALLAIGVVLLPPLLNDAIDDKTARASSASASETAPVDVSLAPPGGELFIGAYGGVPYTYNSDVVFQRRPGEPNFTVRDVAWDGKPFKSPIYYGVRVARWSSASALGGMLDFTHSKVYSQPEQEVRLEGKLDAIFKDKSLPVKAKIKDIFHHFEFTHGHNMLTLNGLYRLPMPHKRLKPYIGAGFGVSLPHSEVQFEGAKARTYEYQYVGPAFQLLVGMELRLPRLSYFFEYKFTVAPYEVPLTNRDGGWLLGDLYRQLQRWWSGRAPKGGWASTTLTSHQLIGGIGVRIARTPVQP